ncbi:MAG: M15 family metallopeptidase [Akkermansiaceae bacterium]|jgi:D-alanyl-D-alanine carboxypeptidase
MRGCGSSWQALHEFGVDAAVGYVSVISDTMDVSPTTVFQELGLSEEFFEQRGLLRFEDADELDVVQTDENGRIHELVTNACEAWQAMKEAALIAGHEIFIVSAFRSASRQAEIVRAKHLSGIGNDEIFAVSAPPGYSEHHTGRAIDVSTPGYPVLEEEFERSEAFSWLEENAVSFGFSMTYPRDNKFGFIYEPWHWSYTGSGKVP